MAGSSVPPKRAGHEKHAEDLISAMKLPDTELLQSEEYVVISDTWKLEWERGVQVPVDPDDIPPLVIKQVDHEVDKDALFGAPESPGFIVPKKFIHWEEDEKYDPDAHELCITTTENVCRYDLDELDLCWLSQLNDLRMGNGDDHVSESLMERIMEGLETHCHEKLQQAIRTVDGLGIEYDENVVCDVCRSPDGEEGNEMVFCDACDICVHQACYGIQNIPEGNWLCRTCALNIQPCCVLCPKVGGAMKSTNNGTKWAHISCALWIPEVTIECPDKMEPITNISQIPPSRWALVCSLCRERVGACIQCAVKTCKTAFHVTCAFQYGLDLKTIVDDDGQDIHMKAFCQKHSEGNEEDSVKGSKRSPELGDDTMTDEERKELRSHRLKKLAEEFYKYINPYEVAEDLQLDFDLVDSVTSYWILKRKMSFDRPLLLPKTEEQSVLMKQRETLIARMNMFIRLRQDLERVRNLCYMLNKREKMRSLLYQMKEDLFSQEATLLESDETVEETAPCFAHRSTGTFYDKPQRIIDAAQSQLIRDEMIDQKSSQALTASASSLLPTSLSIELPQLKVRRGRLSTVQKGDATDAPLTSPPISQIQQLFRDKMEGLESRGWAVASGSEVKTDVGDSDGEEKVSSSEADTDANSRSGRDKPASNESNGKTPERSHELAKVVKAEKVQKQAKSTMKKVVPDAVHGVTADSSEQKAITLSDGSDTPAVSNVDSCVKSENVDEKRVVSSNKLKHIKAFRRYPATPDNKRTSPVRAERRKSIPKNDENVAVTGKQSDFNRKNVLGRRSVTGDPSEPASVKPEVNSEKHERVATDRTSSPGEKEKANTKVKQSVMVEVGNKSAGTVSVAKRVNRRCSSAILDKPSLESDNTDPASTPVTAADTTAPSRLRRSASKSSERKLKRGNAVSGKMTEAAPNSADVTDDLKVEDELAEKLAADVGATNAGKKETDVICENLDGDETNARDDRAMKSPLQTPILNNTSSSLVRGMESLAESLYETPVLLLEKCSKVDRAVIVSENKNTKSAARRRVKRPSATECKTNENSKSESNESQLPNVDTAASAGADARKPSGPKKMAQNRRPVAKQRASSGSQCSTETNLNSVKDDLICFAKLEVMSTDVDLVNVDPAADVVDKTCVENGQSERAKTVEELFDRAFGTVEVNEFKFANDDIVRSDHDDCSIQSDTSCDNLKHTKEEIIVIDEDEFGVRNRINFFNACSQSPLDSFAVPSAEEHVQASHEKMRPQLNVSIKQEEAENFIDLTDDDDISGRLQHCTDRFAESGKPHTVSSKRCRLSSRKESCVKSEVIDTKLLDENGFDHVSKSINSTEAIRNSAAAAGGGYHQQTSSITEPSWIPNGNKVETVFCSTAPYLNSGQDDKCRSVQNFGVFSNGASEGAFKSFASGLGFTFTGASQKPAVAPPSDQSAITRKEHIRNVLMKRFLPDQLVVAESIKQRVIDGLGKLAATRKSSPVICRHTRQKLADCLRLDHGRLEDIRCRGRLTSIRRQSSCVERNRTVDNNSESRRRLLPDRHRRKTYSEWDYVCGDEFSSPLSDAAAMSSDGESLFDESDAEFQLSESDDVRDVLVETERLTVKRRRGVTSLYR